MWIEFCAKNRRGLVPDECPYRAHRDPFVAETIRAYSAFKEGQLEVLWPEIPAVLVESVMLFQREMNIAQAAEWEAKRPPKDGETDG